MICDFVKIGRNFGKNFAVGHITKICDKICEKFTVGHCKYLKEENEKGEKGEFKRDGSNTYFQKYTYDDR